MEMVAAARLRRAEQRIAALRPYAGAIRRMTRQAAEAAGGEIASLPILQEHETSETVAILLVTGDRGLAGAFNSQIVRAGLRAAADYRAEGKQVALLRLRAPRRLVADVPRPRARAAATPASPTARPTPTRARSPHDLMAAYVDGKVDRVEIFYNGYVSPLTQEVRRETLLPLQQATIDEAWPRPDEDEGDQRSTRSSSTSPTPR